MLPRYEPTPPFCRAKRHPTSHRPRVPTARVIERRLFPGLIADWQLRVLFSSVTLVPRVGLSGGLVDGHPPTSHAVDEVLGRFATHRLGPAVRLADFDPRGAQRTANAYSML